MTTDLTDEAEDAILVESGILPILIDRAMRESPSPIALTPEAWLEEWLKPVHDVMVQLPVRQRNRFVWRILKECDAAGADVADCVLSELPWPF